ncbi:MAG: hypothetical protein IPJ34_37620 [Myxococcales bacterium]|nr:hypothetical protein [Myxococcales bacterium]
MWLQLAVSAADVSALFGRLLPLRFDLPGEGRWLELRPPATLAMLPEVGAQLSCPAQVAYAVAGLQPQLTIDPLRLDVGLSLEGAQRNVLVLTFRLDAADTRGVPAFVDRVIADVVNARLSAWRVELPIGELLTRTFPLPAAALPLRSMATHVRGGDLAITADGLALVVSFDLEFA